ncbi:MAG: zinc-ribbon domain-containing protein [Deltaproteobacteria bacterium]|nr:zinc-ribbon domain-containing protein [Deltaproteobacteria bacterium]
MKVVCAKCSSEYNIDPNRIPAHGITIKCPQGLNSFQVKKDGTVAGAAAAGAPAAGAPKAAPAPAPAPAAPAPAVPVPLPAPSAAAGGPSLDELIAQAAAAPPSKPAAAAPAPVPAAARPKDPFSLDDILNQALPEINAAPGSLPTMPDLPDLPPSPMASAGRPAATVAASPAPGAGAGQADQPSGLDYGMFDLGDLDQALSSVAADAAAQPDSARAARASAPVLPPPGAAPEATAGIDQAAKKTKRFKVRRRSGKVFGPFDTDTIVRMLVEHKLLGNEDASEDGATWTPMGQVPEFSQAIRHLMEAPAEPAPVAAPGSPGHKTVAARVEAKEKAPREKKPIPKWAKPAAIGAAVVLLAVVPLVLGQGPFAFKLIARILRGGPGEAERSAQAKAAAALDSDVYADLNAAAGALQAIMPKSSDKDRSGGLLAAIQLVFLQRYGLAQQQTQELQGLIKDLDKSGGTQPEAVFARALYFVLVDDAQKAAVARGKLNAAPDLASLVSAYQAIKQKSPPEAEAALKAYAQARPRSALALHTMGVLRLEQGDPKGAQEWFGKALAASPGHITSQTELAGIMIAGGGDRDAAIEKLKAVISAAAALHPKEAARAQFMLARAYTSKKMPKEALEQFKAAIAANPDERPYQVALGEFFLDNMEFEEAYTAFSKVLQKNRQDVSAGIGMVRAMIAKRKIVEAGKQIAEVLGHAPSNPEAVFYKGQVEEEFEKLDDAIKTYKGVTATAKDYLPPRLALAKIFLRQNNNAEALAELDEAKKSSPESSQVQNARGELLIKVGKSAEAEAELHAAVKADPYLTEARFNLGRALIINDKCKEAVPHIEKVLSQVEKFPYGHFYLAQALHCLKDYPKAVAEYDLALKAAQNDPLVLTRAGQAYSEKGDAAKGIDLLQNALQFDKSSGEAHYQLGMAFRRKGDKENSLESFKTAVLRDGGKAQYRFMFGQCLIKNAMLSEAIEELKAAAEIEPGWAKVQYQLGRAYFLQHNYKAAIGAFNKSHSLDNTRVKALYRVGGCYLQTDDFRNAVKTFHGIVKSDPGFKKAHFKLARAYHLSGKKNDAFGWYKKAIEADKENPMPHYYLGYIYKERKDYANTAKHFKAYLQIAPNDAYASEMKEEIDYLEQAREFDKAAPKEEEKEGEE